MRNRLKSGVQALLRNFGYQMVRVASEVPIARESPVNSALHPHENVTPYATYAPWTRDPSFLSIWHNVQAYTLVDIYRCWELWTLVEQSAKLKGSIIEIGVWRGGTGALMAKKAELCGIEEQIYLCDTFAGVVKAGINDPCYVGGEHADTSRATVEHLIGDILTLSNVVILSGVFPDDSQAYLDRREIRFRLCHIDVDVYQSARDIVNWIWEKLVIGGIVVYDDYGFNRCEGITTFVNEQLSHHDRLVFHNLNGHAIVVKIADN